MLVVIGVTVYYAFIQERRLIGKIGMAEAERLSSLVFGELYNSMRQGGGRAENKAIFRRLSGIEGIEEIKREPCALIFMDMVMPGLNGLDTYRKVKEISPKTSVVLFTGYYRDAYREIFQGIKEGMIDDFIRKPFFPEEIIETARKYIA
jgi:CheY-like chemotaxis protein